MQKWEYMTIRLNAGEYEINWEKAKELKKRPLHEVLTTWGQRGWELVGMASYTTYTVEFILKRPIQD